MGKSGPKLADVIDYTEQKRSFNLHQIKTYNLIKAAIWNCVIVKDSEIPKEDQVCELVLLKDLMHEINLFIDFYILKSQIEGSNQKEISKIENLRKFPQRGSHYDDEPDSLAIQRILKRFRLINPALLY